VSLRHSFSLAWFSLGESPHAGAEGDLGDRVELYAPQKEKKKKKFRSKGEGRWKRKSLFIWDKGMV